MSPENILITGGTGLIGTRLTEMLIAKGHRVSHLSRTFSDGPIQTLTWDIHAGKIDRRALENCSVIVHLAGAGIADSPWTERRKKVILESRTLSAALLVDTLGEMDHKVKALISASGVNYYGADYGERVYTEEDGPGEDFLANVVVQWESEVDRAMELGIRTVKLRTGFVLSDNGGALPEIARPVKWGVGAAVGSGKQRVSWIHLDDVCRMFIKAIEDQQMQGAYNAGGPEPITNKELTRAIARELKRPLWLPNIPAFAIRMLLGQMAELVLKGTAVSSARIQSADFTYEFPTIQSALSDIYSEGTR